MKHSHMLWYCGGLMVLAVVFAAGLVTIKPLATLGERARTGGDPMPLYPRSQSSAFSEALALRAHP